MNFVSSTAILQYLNASGPDDGLSQGRILAQRQLVFRFAYRDVWQKNLEGMPVPYPQQQGSVVSRATSRVDDDFRITLQVQDAEVITGLGEYRAKA